MISEEVQALTSGTWEYATLHGNGDVADVTGGVHSEACASSNHTSP